MKNLIFILFVLSSFSVFSVPCLAQSGTVNAELYDQLCKQKAGNSADFDSVDTVANGIVCKVPKGKKSAFGEQSYIFFTVYADSPNIAKCPSNTQFKFKHKGLIVCQKTNGDFLKIRESL